jgi:hypothetical protein
MNSIRTTSEKAYAGYGESDASGLSYFDAYDKQFSAYDAKEVIAFQVHTYGVRYCIDLLLSSPNLWRNLSEADWGVTLSLACPRSLQTTTATGLDAYADVVFLCKYLGVNGIKLFLTSNEISAEDKKLLVDQVKIFWLDLVLEELDLDDLDGSYFVSKEILDKVAERLLESGRMEKFNNDETSVRRYVDALS